MNERERNQYGFEKISPAFPENNIPVVFATDNNYVPFLGVAIASLVANSSEQYNYDIIILATDVGAQNKSRMARLAKDHPNVSIRWYNIKDAVKKYKFANCSYYTDAIYYRLFMPYVMDEYDRMVYLDCDLVLEKDVALLCNTDIGDNYLGVVRDIGMIIYKYNTSEVQYLPEGYFQKALPNVDIDTYFNSGVLVMNLQAFRRDFTLAHLINETNNKYYLYPDQDGLNNIANEKKYQLALGWNTMPYNLGTRSRAYIDRYLPGPVIEEYDQARQDPCIIHFNMLEKPWLHPCWLDHELMVRFWQYAAATPFFKDLIYYKPSAFYNRTHRAKIPYFERQAVIEMVGKGVCSMRQTQDNVLFCGGKYVVATLSETPIKYETFDFDDTGVTLNASILLGNYEQNYLRFFFAKDGTGKTYRCEMRPKGKPYLFGEREIGQEFILTVHMPVKDKANFTIFASFDGIDVQMKKFNYSMNFPIDRLNRNQYCFMGGYMLVIKGATLCLSRASRMSRLKKELSFERSLWKNHDPKAFVASMLRLPAILVKKMRRRPVWIVGCNYMAGDNGLAFFRYLQTRKKEVRSYFAYNPQHQEAAAKARAIGKVLDKSSRKFQWLSLTSEAAISSVADMRLIRPFAHDEYFRDILARRKFIFLQHGVTTQDQSREHNRFVYNPALFCTCAKQEYDELCQPKYFYNGQVRLTGFARFDYLYHDEKKIITIMPTWRKYYHGDYGENTRFFQFYHTLLHDERLQRALKEYGYTLAFKPHPTVLQKTPEGAYFDGEDDVSFVMDQKSYAETYAESSLVLTDYSSAIFDFLYLRKPIIYTQFDRDEFFSGQHVYEKGYIDYDVNGFGEVETTVEGTVDRIIEYMREGCQLKPVYRERVDNFFAF
ncbi:MAG: CDP-glycerol glycerophosphotransferase family protein, partial [Clostridia bacterium]|nr:CDP-glycerol glycerophosphotransferase family protein [Clostridia bacterium]